MRLALVFSLSMVACVEPGQVQPNTPIEDGECPNKPVHAPVSGKSPRDNPPHEGEGYGYELELDPLCAGGGIMGIPPHQKKQPRHLGHDQRSLRSAASAIIASAIGCSSSKPSAV